MKEYEELLSKLRLENSLCLDIMLFITNLLLLILAKEIFLTKVALSLLVVDYLVAFHGCSEGLAKRYYLSNFLFSFSEYLRLFVAILTVITLIR